MLTYKQKSNIYVAHQKNEISICIQILQSFELKLLLVQVNQVI